MSTDQPLPDTLNATWKNDKNRFGYKFLAKFGWDDKKGLGKDETGITQAVTLKRREDEIGLGMEKMTDGAGNKGWNQTTNGFNSVLASLKSEYGGGKEKKAKKEKKEKKDRAENLSVGIKYVTFTFTFTFSMQARRQVGILSEPRERRTHNDNDNTNTTTNRYPVLLSMTTNQYIYI